MKILLIQTIVRYLLYSKIFVAFFACASFLLLSLFVGCAPAKPSMKPQKMTDAELADIDAQAFFKIEQFAATDLFWTTPTVISQSDIPGTTHYTGGWWSADTADYNVYQHYNTGSTNVIRISLDMDVAATGFIEGQRHGYRHGWQGGTVDVMQWGWDQDHENFMIGNINATGDDSLITASGVYLDLGFDNLANADTRKLNYIELGSMNVNGNVTHTMKRISALLMDSGTGQNDGVLLRQTGSGTRVVTFKNELFSYIFASKYHYEDHEGDGTDVTGFFFKQPSYDTVDDCMRPGGVACEF